jgi:hypothetical protein
MEKKIAEGQIASDLEGVWMENSSFDMNSLSFVVWKHLAMMKELN